ncbi:MAG: hypothetical protein ABH969_08865 [Pseudomonadota bacterium]
MDLCSGLRGAVRKAVRVLAALPPEGSLTATWTVATCTTALPR